MKIICKCCGKEARWCNSGGKKKSCGDRICTRIQCDYCGMSFYLVSEEAHKIETTKEAKILMLKVYNNND